MNTHLIIRESRRQRGRSVPEEQINEWREENTVDRSCCRLVEDGETLARRHRMVV